MSEPRIYGHTRSGQPNPQPSVRPWWMGIEGPERLVLLGFERRGGMARVGLK